MKNEVLILEFNKWRIYHIIKECLLEDRSNEYTANQQLAANSLNKPSNRPLNFNLTFSFKRLKNKLEKEYPGIFDIQWVVEGKKFTIKLLPGKKINENSFNEIKKSLLEDAVIRKYNLITDIANGIAIG